MTRNQLAMTTDTDGDTTDTDTDTDALTDTPQWSGTIADGVPTASVRSTYPNSTTRRQMITSLLESEFQSVETLQRDSEEGTQFTVTDRYEIYTDFPPTNTHVPQHSTTTFETKPTDSVLTVASAFGLVVTGIRSQQTVDDVGLYHDTERVENFDSGTDVDLSDPYTLRLAGRFLVQFTLHDVTGDGFREQTTADPRHPPHPDVSD
jgi:hypothetical protein